MKGFVWFYAHVLVDWCHNHNVKKKCVKLMEAKLNYQNCLGHSLTHLPPALSLKDKLRKCDADDGFF